MKKATSHLTQGDQSNQPILLTLSENIKTLKSHIEGYSSVNESADQNRYIRHSDALEKAKMLDDDVTEEQVEAVLKESLM